LKTDADVLIRNNTWIIGKGFGVAVMCKTLQFLALVTDWKLFDAQ
jgi:hypothetical protein